MIFYTKDGRKINYEPKEEELIHSGKQGSVFHLPNESDNKKCIKIYFETDEKPKTIFDDSNTIFNWDMFSFFKDDFRNPNFCQLYDLLFDENLEKVLGFIMEYYDSIKENILFLPTSYTLDSFNALFKSFLELSDERVIVTDIHDGNVILTSDGIKVIDYDKYRKDLEKEVYKIFLINNDKLLYAFGEIYYSAFKDAGFDLKQNPIIEEKTKYLFSPNTSPLVLKRKMETFEKPIDMIYWR